MKLTLTQADNGWLVSNPYANPLAIEPAPGNAGLHVFRNVEELAAWLKAESGEKPTKEQQLDQMRRAIQSEP